MEEILIRSNPSTICPSYFSPLSTSIMDSPQYPKFKSRDLNEEFTILETIGRGTFGMVVKAERRKKNKDGEKNYFALKKILIENEKEGFPVTALREISLLKSNAHENINRLYEVVTSKPKESNKFRGSVYLVFKYYEYDLYGMLNSQQLKLNLAEVKNILKQILTGLKFLHSKSIIHRDLKSSNVLISKKGEVVLTDFGLSKKYSNSTSHPHTNQVITLWYRPPELLLGSTWYDLSVDMWSVGCIFGEMLIGSCLFRGESEYDMINIICNQLGVINEARYPGCSNLPLFSKFKLRGNTENKLKIRFRNLYQNENLVELLFKMIELDPRKRITAEKALEHQFFKDEPFCCLNEEIPKLTFDFHEYDLRHKKHYDCKDMLIGGNYKNEKNDDFLRAKRKNNNQFIM